MNYSFLIEKNNDIYNVERTINGKEDYFKFDNHYNALEFVNKEIEKLDFNVNLNINNNETKAKEIDDINLINEALKYIPEIDIKAFYTTIDLCRANWFPIKSPSTITIWCNTGKINGIDISTTDRKRYKISLLEIVRILKEITE